MKTANRKLKLHTKHISLISNMFKIMVAIAFFWIVSEHISILTSLTTLDQMCLSVFRFVCIPCNISRDDPVNCLEIDDEKKVINFSGSETRVDYEKYVNTNIKIIMEDGTYTLYSCDSYLKVSQTVYFPIGRKLEYPTIAFSSRSLHDYTPFQDCLNMYCLLNKNHFRCETAFLDKFHFGFDYHVTHKCVQNITMASITTPAIQYLDFNHFFEYAYNLIYLQLELPNLRYFNCQVFRGLRNLRLLDFMHSNFTLDEYKCIFRYNRNLVKIVTEKVFIWNTCDLRPTAPVFRPSTLWRTHTILSNTTMDSPLIITEETNIIDDYETPLGERIVYIVALSLLFLSIVLYIISHCCTKVWSMCWCREELPPVSRV